MIKLNALCRSTVFRAMFEHDMEEKKNSAVNVEDVESDAMESMLQFIYTGIKEVIKMFWSR